MKSLLYPIVVALSLTACTTSRERGDGGVPPGGDGGTGGTLVLSPADAVLATSGMNTVTQPYTVTRNGEDVTSQATLTVDDARLGAFNGATFTSAPGAAGATVVRARVGNDSGQTTLTIKVTAVVIGPNTPQDAPNDFGGAPDGSRAPSIVYPPDGALMPPNLNALEFHWKPGAADLFELHIVGDAVDLTIYTTCPAAGSGCAFEPDEATWTLLSGAGRGKSLMVTMRGASQSGGGVGASAGQTLSFTDEDMEGGLYYWAASTGGVYRYDFGLRGQKAETFYDPALAGGGTQCVGCHALSRDGKRVAVGLNVPEPAQMRALDVATRATLFQVGTGMFDMNGSDFEALTSDGSKIVTTEGGGLTLRDAATGNPIGAQAAVPNADMPDFSPDDKTIVFARGSGGSCQFLCITLSVDGASLFTVPFSGSGFGGPKVLVQSAGENNYYPSYAPGGELVAFNRAMSNSYDAKDARVFVVGAQGGAPLELASVDADAVGNSWPKFSPFIHHFTGQTIYWLTFSSRRDYGVKPSANAQIWMVPLDPARLTAGQDSGYPPLWLPFQDFSTGNHIAQWVEKVERAPCSQIDNSGCMQGEMCVNGVCQPGIQ